MSDLLLLSVDSLRLDHAARAADSRVRTPRFDDATAGFAFSERCFSVASATRPVHTSLVTGLYPFEHGLLGQQDHRVRRGAPRLFAQARDAGHAVGLLSEAPTIFTGLDLGAPVAALDVDADAGLRQVRQWLASTRGQRRCLFLHYWSAHTPYGATDGQALGETARLLREGAHEVVRARYREAVETLFEAKVAPLLEGLDLGTWSVILFGDHGESWTDDELYHGTTVRNSVLRVPLYLHAPFERPAPDWDAGVVSLLDLYASCCGRLGLARADGGTGVDLWAAADAVPRRDGGADWRWAGIRPAAEPAVDELAPQAAPLAAAQTPAASPLRWALIGTRHKLMGDSPDGDDPAANPGVLVDTWSEVAVDDPPAAAAAQSAHAALVAASPWRRGPLEDGSTAQEAILRQRLRDLGYLR